MKRLLKGTLVVALLVVVAGVAARVLLGRRRGGDDDGDWVPERWPDTPGGEEAREPAATAAIIAEEFVSVVDEPLISEEPQSLVEPEAVEQGSPDGPVVVPTQTGEADVSEDQVAPEDGAVEFAAESDAGVEADLDAPPVSAPMLDDADLVDTGSMAIADEPSFEVEAWLPAASAEPDAPAHVSMEPPTVAQEPDDFLGEAFSRLAETPDVAETLATPEPLEPFAAGVEAPEESAGNGFTATADAESAPEETPAAPAGEDVPAVTESFIADGERGAAVAEDAGDVWAPVEAVDEPLSAAEGADLALADSLEEALGDLGTGKITPRPDRHAESYLDEGNVYFNVGQYGLAIERYGRALELDDTLIAAYYNRANAHTRAADFDAALADYNKALELQPNDADALNNRGMLHLYRTNYSEALIDFNAALAADPADTTVMVNRGLAYLHGGSGEAALNDFREALTLDPGDAAAHYGAAQANATLGQKTEALESIGRALELDPAYAREAAADPRLALLQGDDAFMRLLRKSATR